MAVFTPVDAASVQALLDRLRLGRLLGIEGISAGIENSNFFLEAEGGRFVLTLFERLAADELPFYLALMQHLARHGLPVPAPAADAQGQTLFSLSGKPAALVSRLPGRHQLAPDVFHCEQLGQLLARLHQAVADFTPQRPNPRGSAWRAATAAALLPQLGSDEAALLRDELAFQQSLHAGAAYASLPCGAVHADLFRDNALFDSAGLPGRERLCGVFDFYFAGVDSFLFDLAVCVNDWCIDLASGRLVEPRAQALLRAYESERRLSVTEHRLLPALLRAAALRFWLSRLDDWHRPRDAQLLTPHDPRHFENVLRERRALAWHAL